MPPKLRPKTRPSGRVRLDIVAILIVIALVVGGVLTEREALAAKRKQEAKEKKAVLTPASDQLSQLDKMLYKVDRIHKRID